MQDPRQYGSLEKRQLTNWVAKPGHMKLKLKGTVKILTLLNRYAFSNKSVLRWMRIWQQKGLADEISLLM